MFDLNKRTPRFFKKENILYSDQCVWCGDIGNLTRSHLFPKSLGGRFSPITTCVRCNNFLGHKFESEAKKNAFITAAMVKLGLADKKEAFRHAILRDIETGLDMHILEKGGVKPAPKLIDGNKFVGTPEEVKKYAIEKFKHQYPNWPTKPLEEFYDDPSRRSFTYVGMKYTKETVKSGPTKLRVERLTRDPHPYLIFKIACEFIALNGFQSHPIIKTMMNNLVSIDNSDNKNRISFSEKIHSLIQSNTSNTFHEFRRLEDISFRDYHYIIFRLSKGLTLYVEICLFGVLRNFIILGVMPHLDSQILPLIDEAFIFPLDDPEPHQQRYLNLKEPLHTKWADAAVDTRLWELDNLKNQK